MYCTFAGGMQLKMELASLSDYMYGQPLLRPHYPLLAHVAEASSLLTISKDVLTDPQIVQSAFSHLNPLQIRTIISQYIPSSTDQSDSVSPHVVQHFDKSYNLSTFKAEVPLDASNKFLGDCDALVQEIVSK